MTRYRIVTYKSAYAVECNDGLTSLWRWYLWCPGKMDSPPGEYPTIEAAKAEIARLKGAAVGAGEVVWSD